MDQLSPYRCRAGWPVQPRSQ
ncbi:MAG: hypothetical protein Q7U22_04505 [Pararhizobium sp.]|nr:hypothetical protein [Pararhizobium sp.]